MHVGHTCTYSIKIELSHGRTRITRDGMCNMICAPRPSGCIFTLPCVPIMQKVIGRRLHLANNALSPPFTSLSSPSQNQHPWSTFQKWLAQPQS